jgi:hypothetical protein
VEAPDAEVWERKPVASGEAVPACRTRFLEACHRNEGGRVKRQVACVMQTLEGAGIARDRVGGARQRETDKRDVGSAGGFFKAARPSRKSKGPAEGDSRALTTGAVTTARPSAVLS